MADVKGTMNADPNAPPGLVLAIHGLSSKRLWMSPLCARLRARTYRVANWGYASVFGGSIATHGLRLFEHLTETLGQETRIHIVAHSLGSIVVRSALSQGAVSNLGRIVFLAPPNKGAPIARLAGPLLGRICKPIEDLSDREDSYVNTLPTLDDIDVAVVAARFDTLVPIANTRLGDHHDHVVLNATHNSLLLSSTAADIASTFLSTGRL